MASTHVFTRVVAVVAAAGIASMTMSPSAQAQVTYQQILANPDDLKLNLEYARQAVASGRLQEAASALERLLLHRPNWDAVRLFYALVLYRLGNLDGSKRELEKLEGRGLSAKQEADRVKYLALINKIGADITRLHKD